MKEHKLTGCFPRGSRSTAAKIWYCRTCGIIVNKSPANIKALQAPCPDNIDV